MPKLKTGLLVRCAMRNARRPSKGTKERASISEAQEVTGGVTNFVARLAEPANTVALKLPQLDLHRRLKGL
jgi:hypothetical protein